MNHPKKGHVIVVESWLIRLITIARDGSVVKGRGG